MNSVSSSKYLPSSGAQSTLSYLPVRLNTGNFHLEIASPTQENAGRLAFISRQNFKHLLSYQPWVNETRTLKGALAFLKRDYLMFQEGQWMNYSIIKDGSLAGGIRLRNWQDGSCSLSYWLTRKHQKQGLMAQALSKIEEEHFKHSDAVLLLQIDSQNTSSLNRAQKSGYRQQYLTHNGFDCILMGEIPPDETQFLFIKTHEAFLKQRQEKRLEYLHTR